MAHEIEDFEFLLPSELLTEDDLLTDFGRGFGISECFSSNLSSQVDSVTGLVDAGRDEDGVIDELTRKLSRSCSAKGLKLPSSPQSTLFGFNPGSNGSPSSDSGTCSPPEAKSALSWDVLYAAAEEVARMRRAEEMAAFYSHELFPLVRIPGHVAAYHPDRDRSADFYLQLHSAKMRQDQLMMMAMMMMKNGVDARRYGVGVGAYDLPTKAFPDSQLFRPPTVSSGHKMAFPGERKDRVGTGVFMPRRFSPILSETPKQPEFSIDARLHHRGPANFTSDYDAILKLGSYDLTTAHHVGDMRSPPFSNQELSLPQEWSY